MQSATAQPVVYPKIRPGAAVGFAIVHLAALGVFAVGFSWKGVALCLVSYYVRMFAITAGFHRYFSHRTYNLNRFWQFMLAFLGQTAAQKGVLWWAANHRHHHKYSDQPEDLHSPVQRGFWWSHMGWIMCDEYSKVDYKSIPDLAKYPELRFLDRNQYMPTMLYAVALALTFGPMGLFYGYFLSTVLLWHGTFSINSVMHVFGKRVYPTTDDSRNSFIFALVTMGEGWHNNHHHYPGSAAQGFRWWQLDGSYYVLLIAEKLGIVKGMRRVPARIVEAAGKYVNATTANVSTAGDRVHEKIEQLSIRWAELKSSAQIAAHHAVDEYEAATESAAARLRQLEADYAAAKQRAGAAAYKRLEELRAEIEKSRIHLLEALERLIAAAELALGPQLATS
ncbi:MAG TPA: acyl-CoA desaturase [Thermoanaerobaculia bacterium]|nr:acyl-CoA desaturase [Thermoanaerobaculia bacterium]